MPLEHRTRKHVTPGRSYPLGATPAGDGVNFAIYSRHATDMFLLLFDKPNGEPTDVIQLQNRDKFVWHAAVEGLRAGQLYGYKVERRVSPRSGDCDSTTPSSCSIRTRRPSPGSSATPTTCCSPTTRSPGGGELVLDTRDTHRDRAEGDRHRRRRLRLAGRRIAGPHARAARSSTRSTSRASPRIRRRA